MPPFRLFFSLGVLMSVVIAPAAGRTLEPSTSPQTILLKTHIPPRTAGGKRYNYLSFNLPPYVGRIDIWCDYDQAQGKNVVGLGLFDSRSTDVTRNLDGFRGMSPRSRDAGFLSANTASYGYVTGSLPSGTWHVFLDAYKALPAGVDVSVTIVLTSGGNVSGPPTAVNGSRPSAEISQSRQTRKWFRGDLHMHTLHSDGALTVPALAAVARREGLDFICITDHNVASQHADIARLQKENGFLVLPGEEVTTDGGHIGACGLPFQSLLDFRISSADNSRLAQLTGEGHRLGALLTVNHPFADCQACDWSFNKTAPGFDTIEVWNSAWDPSDRRAVALWDSLLRSGRRITAVADSDTHRDTPGAPTTVVSAPSLDQKNLFDAIRRGKVYLEATPQAGNLTFEASLATEPERRYEIGDTIALPKPATVQFRVKLSSIPGGGATVSLISGNSVPIQQALTEGSELRKQMRFQTSDFVRVEVRDPSGSMLVMSNPIFVRVGAGSR